MDDDTENKGSWIMSNYEGDLDPEPGAEQPIGCGGSVAATCLTLILILVMIF